MHHGSKSHLNVNPVHNSGHTDLGVLVDRQTLHIAASTAGLEALVADG